MWKDHYLMSLDIPLLKMEMAPEDGTVGRILEVYNKQALPYSVDGSRESFIDWSRGRRIPASRKHMKTFKYKDKLDYLLYNSMALSLSDSFWIKPCDLLDSWEDVNFFDNDFTDEVGEWLVNGEGQLIDLKSPSNSTDGVYPKKWIIIDGFRALAKQGDRDSYQYDDVSEIIVSEILQILTKNNNISYAIYFRVDQMTCASWNFVKKGHNLISAGRYLIHNNIDPECNTKDMCLQFLKNSVAWSSIELMLVLDYIVFNIDRHFGNFGFIQDAKIGEIIGSAPIYDTGCSLFAAMGAGYRDDLINKDFKARPFASTHNLQIELVEIQKYREELEDLLTNIDSIFHREYLKVGVKEEYIQKLLNIVKIRIKKLISLKNVKIGSVNNINFFN